jgi:hypothetical protein
MSVASCFQQSEAIRTVNLPFSSSLTHVGQLPSLIQIHTQFGSNVVSSLVRSTVAAVRPHVRLSRCRDESRPTDSTSPTAPPLRLQSEAQLLSDSACDRIVAANLFAISDFGSLFESSSSASTAKIKHQDSRVSSRSVLKCSHDSRSLSSGVFIASHRSMHSRRRAFGMYFGFAGSPLRRSRSVSSSNFDSSSCSSSQLGLCSMMVRISSGFIIPVTEIGFGSTLGRFVRCGWDRDGTLRDS